MIIKILKIKIILIVWADVYSRYTSELYNPEHWTVCSLDFELLWTDQNTIHNKTKVRQKLQREFIIL
jgi:hypothetical protein